MSIIEQSQADFMTLKRQVLFVICLCYLPLITNEPAWLFGMFITVIGYRVIADYYNYPPMPRFIRFILFLGTMFLLYGDMISVGFFIRCLLAFIILKFLEIRTVRDLKVIVICNFFLIFSSLIIVRELWIIVYLFVGVLANLSVMLKLSAPQASLKQIASKSGQQLLIAIPLTLLLFYFFPRVSPLWDVPSLAKTSTGFNDTMSPGSIAELYNDSSDVMQITFKKSPIFNGYWQGIILSFYNGKSWTSSVFNYSSFSPVLSLQDADSVDYEIILEPTFKKWLFYQGDVSAGQPSLLYSRDHGLMRQNKQAVTDRFIYSVKIQSTPYHALKPYEYTEATRLPKNIDPKLSEWSQQQFAATHKDVKAFITLLRNYIHDQPFWYTLTPPLLTDTNNQMDEFWFNTQKGFCEHYASAVAFILRSVGIPARVILGYQGGNWNPISHAISIQQSDAHAWIEYWQEGAGWQRLDPTSFISPDRIDPAIQNREDSLNQDNNTALSDLSLEQRIIYFYGSMQFFYERWFLFYNGSTQQNLLKNLGLGNWKMEQLLQVSVGSMVLFFILLEIGYRWWQKRRLNPILLEYHLLQKQFQKFSVATGPSATLQQQCNSLIDKVPALGPVISSFLHRYEQLRLKQQKNDSRENKKETLVLFKSLRYALRGHKN